MYFKEIGSIFQKTAFSGLSWLYGPSGIIQKKILVLCMPFYMYLLVKFANVSPSYRNVYKYNIFVKLSQPKKADYSYYNNYSDTIVNHYSITVKIMLFHTIVITLITVVLL